MYEHNNMGAKSKSVITSHLTIHVLINRKNTSRALLSAKKGVYDVQIIIL